MAGDNGDQNKLSRNDFLKDKKVKIKDMKTRAKTPAKVANKEKIENNDDNIQNKDKMDKVIELLNTKDDKIVNAMNEMTNTIKNLISNQEKNTKEANDKEDYIKKMDEQRKNNTCQEFNESISKEALDFLKLKKPK